MTEELERRYVKAVTLKEYNKSLPLTQDKEPVSSDDSAKTELTACSEQRWTATDFDIGNEIGRGRYGTVFKGIHKSSKKSVALKVVTTTTIRETGCFGQLKNEIEINTRLLHPNIVRMYGFFPYGDKLTMVMELVEGGDLFSLLCNSGYLSEPQAAFVLRSVSEALLYLHERHIVHDDVKPENVLLNTSPSGKIEEVKLCDFSCARSSFKSRRATVAGCEVYNGKEVSAIAQRDVWGVGVLLYQMLTGELRVKRKTQSKPRASWSNLVLCYPETPALSEEATRLIERVLSPDPDTRTTLTELHNDPWTLTNAQRYAVGSPAS